MAGARRMNMILNAMCRHFAAQLLHHFDITFYFFHPIRSQSVDAVDAGIARDQDTKDHDFFCANAIVCVSVFVLFQFHVYDCSKYGEEESGTRHFTIFCNSTSIEKVVLFLFRIVV